MKILLVVFGAFLLSSTLVKSSSLIKSPWGDDMSNLLSLIFQCESGIQELKFDRKSEKWVEECPVISCEHGVDNGDQETCPSCLLGPGEKCGDWSGKCGEEMKCRYASAFAPTGTCVLESEFNSRKAGESCGHYEGECGEGLKCRKDADLVFLFCGIEEPGVCVTNEEFKSRKEGQSCGETAGECIEGLKCNNDEFGLFASVCKNLTSNNSSDQDGCGGGIFFEETVENTLSENGKPEEHVHMKITNHGNVEDEKMVEEFVKSEVDSFLEGDEEQEKEIMQEVHDYMVNPELSEAHITHTGKVGEKEEFFSIDIEGKHKESAANSEEVAIETELSDLQEKTMQKTMEADLPSVEIL